MTELFPLSTPGTPPTLPGLLQSGLLLLGVVAEEEVVDEGFERPNHKGTASCSSGRGCGSGEVHSNKIMVYRHRIGM